MTNSSSPPLLLPASIRSISSLLSTFTPLLLLLRREYDPFAYFLNSSRPLSDRHVLEEVRHRRHQAGKAGEDRGGLHGELRGPVLGCQRVDDEAPAELEAGIGLPRYSRDVYGYTAAYVPVVTRRVRHRQDHHFCRPFRAVRQTLYNTL